MLSQLLVSRRYGYGYRRRSFSRAGNIGFCRSTSAAEVARWRSESAYGSVTGTYSRSFTGSSTSPCTFHSLSCSTSYAISDSVAYQERGHANYFDY